MNQPSAPAVNPTPPNTQSIMSTTLINDAETGIQSWIEEVDAERAKALLEKAKGKVRNRRLSDTYISRYKEMILENQWYMNGETISLDKEGYLINGQHRLTAIIEANKVKPGTKVKIMMVSGVEREAISTIDSGNGRSVAQSAQMSGIEVSATKISISRYCFLQPNQSRRELRYLNRLKLINNYVEYKEAIDFASRAFCREPILFAAYRAIIVRAYLNGVDKKKLQRFMEVVDTGMSTSETEIPAILLRNMVLRYRKISNFTTSIDFYCGVQWCLKKYLDGTIVKSKTVGKVSKPLFPVPAFDIEY
jgi:hypothetical protein